MSKADLEMAIGVERTKLLLDSFGGFAGEYGVEVWFSHRDDEIYSVRFTQKFSPNVRVFGLQIGMDLDAMRSAIPELALPPGSSGEPNEHGWVRYAAVFKTIGCEICVDMRSETIGLISLKRSDLDEVLKRNKAQEEEWRVKQAEKRDRANRWKTIADPEDMLRDWAAQHSSWGEKPDVWIEFADWLINQSTPNDWHYIVNNWNWDNGHAPLFWIVKQDECDKATALEIFFAAEPYYFVAFGLDRSSVPGMHRIVYDLIMEIKQRFEQGRYTRSTIEYDPGKRSPPPEKLETAAYQAVYPSQCRKKLSGTRINAESHNCKYPFALPGYM